jgi:hypothetical protein
MTRGVHSRRKKKRNRTHAVKATKAALRPGCRVDRVYKATTAGGRYRLGVGACTCSSGLPGRYFVRRAPAPNIAGRQATSCYTRLPVDGL